MTRNTLGENAELRAALKSIYVAAFETKSCLAAIEERNQPPNYETEARLSKLWVEAAVELCQIDEDLAERCLLKGDYWSNPNRWTEQQIDKSRINVNGVFDDARKLL